MKTVKKVCKFCKKAEEYNKWEIIRINICVIIVTILCMIGVLFIVYIANVGVDNILYEISGASYTREAIKYHDDVRFKAVEITKKCDGDNQFCLAKQLYKNMSQIRYIPDSKLVDKSYNPMYVYENGDDCEGLAQMYVAFALSVGVDSKVECSKTHCVAVVLAKDFKIVIDLTTPSAYVIKKTKNFFEIEKEHRMEVWVDG